MDVLIANTHTIFNVASAIVFMPFTKQFVSLLERLVKPHEGWDTDDDSNVLDKLLLNTPLAAVQASKKGISLGTKRSKEMLRKTMEFIYTGDMGCLDQVKDSEQKLNALQRNQTRYVVQLSKGNLTGIQASIIPGLITCMNHVERTGDHAIDLVELAQIKVDRHLHFSEKALADLKDLESLVMDMFDLLVDLLSDGPRMQEDFKRIKCLEDDVDVKAKELVDGHVERLEQGSCTVESGVYFMDIVNFLERISDHIFKAARDLRSGEMGNKDNGETKI